MSATPADPIPVTTKPVLATGTTWPGGPYRPDIDIAEAAVEFPAIREPLEDHD